MTANDFFEQQLITDANSIIDKTRQKYSRNDLINFAEAYHKSKVKNLNITSVIKSLPEYNEVYYHAKLDTLEQFKEYWKDITGNVL